MERTALAGYDIPVGAGLSCVCQIQIMEVKQLWYQDTYR